MATTIRDNRVIPAALSERWELLVKEAGKRIFDRRKKLLKAVGDRPYRGIATNEDEARATWAQMRRDPEAIMNLLAENVRVKPAGGLLFPKDLIERMVEMESHMPKDRGPEERSSGREAFEEVAKPETHEPAPSLRFEEEGQVGDADALEDLVEAEGVPSEEDEPELF